MVDGSLPILNSVASTAIWYQLPIHCYVFKDLNKLRSIDLDRVPINAQVDNLSTPQPRNSQQTLASSQITIYKNFSG